MHSQVFGRLLTGIAFFLPLSVALTNLLITLFLLLTTFTQESREQWQKLTIHPVGKAAVLWIAIHALGLFWSEDFQGGLLELGSSLRFLLLAFLMVGVGKGWHKQILVAFLCSMTFCLALATMASFGLIYPDKAYLTPVAYLHWQAALGLSPGWEVPFLKIGGSPFISRIHYSPLLAFFLIWFLWMRRSNNLRTPWPLVCAVLVVGMLSLVLTEGRAGQVLFLALAALWMIIDASSRFQAAIRIMVLLLGIVFLAQLPPVQMRYQQILLGFQNFQAGTFGYGIGDRLIHLVNGWDQWRESPIFGHGTGSFEESYARVNEVNYPHLPHTDNPHNMFVLTAAQFGILGLGALLYLFWSLCWHWFHHRHMLWSQPFLFLLVGVFLLCFSDTYLWGLPSQNFFVLFTGVFGYAIKENS